MAKTQNFKPNIPLSISSFHHSSFTSLPRFSLKSPNNSHFFDTNLSRTQNYQYPVLIFTRKSIIPSVSGLWDAITGGDSAREALIAIRRGMQLFRQGDVPGSVVEFDKAIELDPRQKIFGRGGYHFTTLIGSRKGQSNLGLMLHKIQMTLRSQYGAFSVKLSYMESMKRENDFSRLVEIHGLSCGKLITCSKMGVTRRSLLKPFQVGERENISMPLCMPGFITNVRVNLVVPSFI